MKLKPLAIVLLLLGATSLASAATPESATGTLTGQFLYDGTPPKPKEIVSSTFDAHDDAHEQPRKVRGAALIEKYKPFDESLLVNDSGGIANIFVWVRSKDIPTSAVPNSEPPTITFEQARFNPHAMAFQIPQKLTLRNKDPSEFCIVGLSLTSDGFNRILAAQQDATMNVSAPELVPSQLISNVQPWASACIFPLAHPYVAITGADGKFKIENLPPGKWEFQTWHERAGYLHAREWKRGRFTMEIKPGANNLGIIKLDPKQFDR